MSEYRIEKVRRHVSLALSGVGTLKGDIFLQPSARYRAGPQDPAELFNEPEAFIPFVTDADDLILLAKERVAWVQFDDEDSDTSPDGTPGTSVEVVLTDGSRLDGELRLDTRSDRSRLVDFMNGGHQRFLSLRSPAAICLVNWREIAQVRERR
jgi:hypothetical protein